MTKSYNNTDRAFSVICFILGYFFISWCLLSFGGIGTAIVAVALLTSAIVYFYLTTKKALSKRQIMSVILLYPVALGFLFNSAGFVGFINTSLFGLGFLYLYYCICSNKIDQSYGEYLFFDLIRSIFPVPFCSFGEIFVAMFKKGEGDEKKGHGNIILGLLAAIIPAAIVTLLLASDMAFEAMLLNVFGLGRINFGKIILCCILGIPVAMYFFGAMFGNLKNPVSEVLSKQRVGEVKEKAQSIMPQAIFAATIPIIIVYFTFFISQLFYLISAFSTLLPREFSYSEYARQGFFELCAVCVINLLIICFISAFTKRNENKMPVTLKVSSALISVFTIMLVAIDITKMFLYISRYGLTQKRVITSVFMLLLGLVFVFILLKQFIKGFKVSVPIALTAVIISAALIFSNVDAIIAGYNVAAYKSGRLESVDIEAMKMLDDSSVYAVSTLLDDDEYYYEAYEFLEYKAERVKNKSLNTHTIHTFIAKKILKENDFI